MDPQTGDTTWNLRARDETPTERLDRNWEDAAAITTFLVFVVLWVVLPLRYLRKLS